MIDKIKNFMFDDARFKILIRCMVVGLLFLVGLVMVLWLGIQIYESYTSLRIFNDAMLLEGRYTPWN